MEGPLRHWRWREGKHHAWYHQESSQLVKGECRIWWREWVQVVAQRTHPSAQTGRSAASALALKAATAVLHSLLDADPLPESITVPPACLFTSKARSDLWHAVARGEEPVCEARSPRYVQ